MSAYAKRGHVRSRPLLRACRELACQHCGLDDGTVVAAHSNAGEHGKGKAMKADDSRVAALCHLCHAAIDQGSLLSQAERVELWERAHARTVRALVRRSLWPDGVPVPGDVRADPGPPRGYPGARPPPSWII